MKKAQIHAMMDAAVDGDYIWEGVKESPVREAYRNKMEFSFGDEFKDGPLSLGLHKKGSTYDVLTAGDCQLVHEDMDKILLCVLNYFKERNVSYYKKMQHVGYLRHLLLRRGDTTGEILVNLVTTTQEEYDLTPLVEELLALELEGKIVGILHILNYSLSIKNSCLITLHDIGQRIIQYMKDYDANFRILEEPLMKVGVGVAFSKNDKRDLCEKLDKTLKEMRKDGTSKKIIGKYLSDPEKYLEVDDFAY